MCEIRFCSDKFLSSSNCNTLVASVISENFSQNVLISPSNILLLSLFVINKIFWNLIPTPANLNYFLFPLGVQVSWFVVAFENENNIYIFTTV